MITQNYHHTQLVFQKAVTIWRSTLLVLLSFSINHEFEPFLTLSDILNGMPFAYHDLKIASIQT
jgi:hypothetical protein